MYFDGLSARSRYFYHPFAFDRASAEAVTADLDADDHYRIVATAVQQGQEAIVGYAWLDGLAGPDIPMLGIGIIDDYHERGIGKLLLAARRDRRGQPQAFDEDHHTGPTSCACGSGSGRSGLQRGRRRSTPGGRHHLRGDVVGVCLRGGGAGGMEPPGGGLVDGHPPAHLRTELVLDALNMAIWQRRPQGVVHHSDQGSQYTSIAFGARCKEAGVRPSTGLVGDAVHQTGTTPQRCDGQIGLGYGGRDHRRRAGPAEAGRPGPRGD